MKAIKVDQQNLLARDAKHLWHPLTQHGLNKEHLAIAKASGVYLYDEEGRTYLDGIASWYTAMYGHSHPYIVERVKAQLDKLDQVVFTGLTHLPAIEMSEALKSVLPSKMEKFFFSDNGSTSVDVALKMAIQFFYNRGQNREKIIAFESAFHGDTFGAMAASGLAVYNGPFEKIVMQVERIPVPTEENWEAVKALFAKQLENEEVAAFIFEPLVQGAAAMNMYDKSFLEELMAMAREKGSLCIADEVMTGFGKTGKYFAVDHLSIKPDIMCLSKALTAGIAPMGLTCASQEVFEAFYDQDIIKGFFHGHTYSANPMACTAALAGIELLKSEEIQSAIKRITEQHASFADRISRHPLVKSTRNLGVIFALDLDLEMERYGDMRDQLYQFFLGRGLFLRPLGHTMYILAPYIITAEEMETIYQGIEACLNHLSA